MKLLLDVDAMCKLAHWGLLEELPQITGIDWSDCATLTSVKYRAKRAAEKPDGRVFKTTSAATEAIRAIEKMRNSLEPSVAGLAEFESVQGIDPGEAILFSAMTTMPGSKLLTGDKRAIRALADVSAATRDAYAGRILLIEHIVLAALDAHTLQWLREHVCPEKAIDIAISISMGSRCDAPEPSVREGLLSYINEIYRLYDPSLLVETEA